MSSRLKELDKVLQGRSPYRVEGRERQAEELDKYAVPASQALYTLLRLYLRGRLPPLPGGAPVPAPAIP